MEVIIARAKVTQVERLSLGDRTFAVLRMERRKMEVVVSVSVFVVDRLLNFRIGNL